MFTLVYSLSALCKISPTLPLLLLGRVLGGVATSILCTTFEAWWVIIIMSCHILSCHIMIVMSCHVPRYVHQHTHTLHLPPAWLSSTFTSATFYTGLLAITAGLASNLLAEDLGLGPLAPFLAAVPLLGVCSLLLAATWQENTGDRSSSVSRCWWEGLQVKTFSQHSELLSKSFARFR